MRRASTQTFMRELAIEVFLLQVSQSCLFICVKLLETDVMPIIPDHYIVLMFKKVKLLFVDNG